MRKKCVLLVEKTLFPRKVNNVKNNDDQRSQPKQLGGITGRGFLPGHSGNPNGRPRTRGLLGTLRVRISEVGPDGRSLEDRLIDVLVQEALRGRHRLAAVETIFDRLEGRARASTSMLLMSAKN